MSAFPFRLFKDGVEIVFPKGARRYISCDVALVEGDGEVEDTIYGGAVYTGSSAFRRHMVSLSCTDQTVAPLAGIFKGDELTLHSPTEMAVAGSSVTLPYDAVPGSVYGVDADDRIVGRKTSGSRVVNIPGADVIRFRPVMKCLVKDRSFSSTFGRGQSGWGLTLRDVDGFDGGDAESDALTVRLSPQLFPASFDQGASFSLDLAALTTVSEGGLTVAYTLESGSSLPPGVSRTGGVVSGTLTTPGLHVFAVRATALNAFAVQTYAVHVRKPEALPLPWAVGTGGQVFDYTDTDGASWRSHTFLSTGQFLASTAGLVEVLIVGGGGGAGYDYGGGGGAGGVVGGGVVRCHVSEGSHPVVVGAGGAPGVETFGNRYGRKGTDSAFRGLIGLGGGGGIGSNDSSRGVPDGGCGGGDGPSVARGVYTPGQGYNGQGHNGGFGSASSDTGKYHSGGAGGAGGPGANFNAPIGPMTGGVGIVSDITGVPTHYAGGGAGYGTTHPGPPPAGGSGGGGNAANKNGVVNTGGGGGSSGGTTYGYTGGSGGSGIVIIRYRTS